MLKALVKTRLAALWASFYARGRNAKGGKKPSKIGGIGIAILLIYAAIVFAGMFSAMFFGIAELYHAQGIGWLYFALAGILAAAMAADCPASLNSGNTTGTNSVGTSSRDRIVSPAPTSAVNTNSVRLRSMTS